MLFTQNVKEKLYSLTCLARQDKKPMVVIQKNNIGTVYKGHQLILAISLPMHNMFSSLLSEESYALEYNFFTTTYLQAVTVKIPTIVVERPF